MDADKQYTYLAYAQLAALAVLLIVAVYIYYTDNYNMTYLNIFMISAVILGAGNLIYVGYKEKTEMIEELNESFDPLLKPEPVKED